MELDDLKNIWKQEPFPRKREEEIAAMLRGKSKSVIAKLRRNILFELYFTILTACLLLFFTFQVHNGALRWSLISFMILFAGYIIYYIKKVKLLGRFNITDSNVKRNLEELIHTLYGYIDFYRKSYQLVYPIYFVLILIFVGIDYGLDTLMTSLSDPRMILYMIFLLGILIATILWLTNWYLDKLYGHHLAKLKKLLEEIDT